MSDRPALPRVDVVVLSQGSKPEDLDRCLRSVLAQEGVATSVLCVGNGWVPQGLPDGVRSVHVPENVGAPEGRNIGAEDGDAPLLFFLDDDASLPETDALRRLVDRFRDGRVGLVQPRIVDPVTGRTETRWIPRLFARDAERSGPAPSVAEGACLVRREALERAGGWAGLFFYGHEGIELAWRVWDQGLTVQYAGDVVAAHPAGPAFSRGRQMWMNGRNRVWLARRNLPTPLAWAHVASWTAVTRWRLRHDPQAWAQWRDGRREGWRTPCGERRVMRWSTVATLTRIGRPPVV